MPPETTKAFGAYLRRKMAGAGVPLRKLARLSGLDPSVVARLAAGKGEPEADQLEKLAKALHLRTAEMWQGAAAGAATLAAPAPPGIPTSHSEPAAHSATVAALAVTEAGAATAAANLNPDDIRTELEKYRQYAQTSEGHELIMNRFPAKLAEVDGVGPFVEKLKSMHEMYRADGTAPNMRWLLGSGLLYFIASADLIPDYQIPFGYIDDAMAIDMVWAEAQR